MASEVHNVMIIIYFSGIFASEVHNVPSPLWILVSPRGCRNHLFLKQKRDLGIRCENNMNYQRFELLFWIFLKFHLIFIDFIRLFDHVPHLPQNA